MQVVKRIEKTQRKNRGISLLELVIGIALSTILFQVLNPVLKGTMQVFSASQERSLGMTLERIEESIRWYSDSSIGGRVVLIQTIETLSNRNIDLEKIRAKGEIGNGVYIEVVSLCSAGGRWKLVREGHIFRFMDTVNQGRHMRYIPLKSMRGEKEDIISSDVVSGMFFQREGRIFFRLQQRKGALLEKEIYSRGAYEE